MRRNADGYPDASGANTAISFAITVKYAQAFLQHPPAEAQVSTTTASHPVASASQR